MPILMYHVIGTARPGTPNPDLFVSRAAFAAQMRWLHAHAFKAVTLEQVYRYCKSRLAAGRGAGCGSRLRRG